MTCHAFWKTTGLGEEARLGCTPRRSCDNMPSKKGSYQQDTKEYLNQRGTSIRVFRESKKGG